jgi:hypothetical protein
MDTIQHHRARLGVCRQRAYTQSENASILQEVAAIRERLVVLAELSQMLKASITPPKLHKEKPRRELRSHH